VRYLLPAQKKRVFAMTIPIRWGDMDAMGHLNNTSYFRYMETCRIDWLASLNCVPSGVDEGIVIVNAFCNFYRQLTYPGDVVLTMYASDPARTTFETWVTMACSEEPAVVCAEGGATTIWVDYAAQKAKDLPGWLRALVS
jgi:acyl-CoA thioester hydrolase